MSHPTPCLDMSPDNCPPEEVYKHRIVMVNNSIFISPDSPKVEHVGKQMLVLCLVSDIPIIEVEGHPYVSIHMVAERLSPEQREKPEVKRSLDRANQLRDFMRQRAKEVANSN